MKFLCLTVLALMGLLSFAQAQPGKPTTSKNTVTNQQPADDEQWLFDKYYDYVKKETQKGKNIMAGEDAGKLADYINTNPELKAKKARLYRQTYTRKNQYKPTAGMSDRIMLLVGIPEPKSPSAALQADPRENEKYLEKIKHFKEQAEEEARKIANTTDLMKTYKRDGEAGVKKKYEDKADQNEIVRDMGGAKALQNMSEKEREEAAKKMVARQTGGYTADEIQKMTPAQRQALALQMAGNRSNANGNDGAAAFTKMLMADPGYRASYEKLSNAEKQKVYQEFLQNTGAAPTVPKQTKEMKESEDEAREAIAITKIADQFRKELKDLFDPVAQQEKQYVKEIDESRQELSRWITAETEKLPAVRDSEYGERKDGIERVMFMQAVLSFAIGKDEVAKEQEIWERYLDAYYVAFHKLDEWTARYEKRNDLSDQLKLQLAQLKIAGYDAVIEMNRKAGYITGVAGSVQYNYNCEALRDCHDPRQDKYSAGQ